VRGAPVGERIVVRPDALVGGLAEVAVGQQVAETAVGHGSGAQVAVGTRDHAPALELLTALGTAPVTDRDENLVPIAGHRRE